MGDEITRIAIHEAGHAVACVRLFPSRVSDNVSIEPDHEEMSLGRHASEELRVSVHTSDNQADVIFLAEATYCCAGYAALLAAGHSKAQALAGCDQDFDEAGSFLEAGKRDAVELMRRPENLRAVELIAKELLQRKRLNGDHVAVLIDFSDGETTAEEYRAYLGLLGDAPGVRLKPKG